MGTINYKTSDFITLGYNLNNADHEDDFYYDDINFEYEEINALLKNEYFTYFDIKLEPGYYEGFSIDIEYNFSYCLDSYFEKLEAQKEITKIKKILIYMIENFNVCAVGPGWCTSYYDYEETISRICDAVEEMRGAVKETPTYYTLQLKGEY